jgi:hypothetical protein
MSPERCFQFGERDNLRVVAFDEMDVKLLAAQQHGYVDRLLRRSRAPSAQLVLDAVCWFASVVNSKARSNTYAVLKRVILL